MIIGKAQNLVHGELPTDALMAEAVKARADLPVQPDKRQLRTIYDVLNPIADFVFHELRLL